MGRVAELRARVQRRTSNLYDTLFTRRVSIYFTMILAPLGVSANQVSLVNVLNGLAAAALIGLGEGPALWAGLGMVHLYAVLDSVDGELARYHKAFSLRGLFLEDLSAYAAINALWLGFAGYLHRTMSVSWPLIVAVLLAAFGRNAMPVARRAMLKSVATHRPLASAGADGGSAGGPPAGPPGDANASRSLVGKTVAWVRTSLLHFTNIWVVMTALVAIELAIVPPWPVVAVGFVFYSIGLFARELAIIVRYLATRALDRELDDIYTRARAPVSAPVTAAMLAGDEPPPPRAAE